MSIFWFLNASRFSGQVAIASDIDLGLFPIEGDFPKFLLIDLERELGRNIRSHTTWSFVPLLYSQS